MTSVTLEDFRLELGGKVLLDGLSFEVSSGERVGLIGLSGAGKSMTALALMGLLPEGSVTSGRLLIDGVLVDPVDDEAMRVHRGGCLAMIFQEPLSALDPLRSIGFQVAEAARLSLGVSWREAYEIAKVSCFRAGLDISSVPLSRLPQELSGGQCQRVMIALALAGRPRLLVADEPTTALDTVTQSGILSLLGGLAADEGMGLFLISHDLAVVSSVVDRVLVMEGGRIVDESVSRPFGSGFRHRAGLGLLSASLPSASVAPSGGVDSVLRVEGVCKSYRDRSGLFGSGERVEVVRDVGFELHRGECLGVAGSSGAGKSTLTRLVLGLESVDSGEIVLCPSSSVSPSMDRSSRRRLGAVFQDSYGSFNPRHRVGRIVSEPLDLLSRSLSAGDRRSLVLSCLDQVGLPSDSACRHIHEFSGGERQRIAIARALVTSPDVIVFDEATSSLDVLTRSRILSLISVLVGERGVSALFISHDLAVVGSICHRVMIMDRGRVVETGLTSSVFASPSHVATRSLLAALPEGVA